VRKIQRRAERLFLNLTVRFWQKKRHGRLVTERISGCDLIILPAVMNPVIFRSGAYFASVLERNPILPSTRVLDMGAGCGIAGIIAARQGARVVAVDINAEAVRCTRINTLLNDVEQRVEVRHGDLFGPLCDERFDLVLFNPPYFRGKPRPGFDQSWRSNDVVERFAANLRRHLNPGARALLALSTHGDSTGFLRAFDQNGYDQTVIARRRMLGETFSIYRFTPRDGK
jgi:release factor glutamine methyltransferase